MDLKEKFSTWIECMGNARVQSFFPIAKERCEYCDKVTSEDA